MREVETTVDALWDCVVVQDIWVGSIRKLQKWSVHGQTDMKQLMAELLEHLMPNEMNLFWAQAWLIWNQRNCVVHGGKLKDPSSLNKRVEELVDEFKQA